MSRVVITVGAQADRSLVDVVRPFAETWKKARAQATADARATTRMAVAEFNAQAALHRQYVRSKIQAERDAARETAALQRRASQETRRALREEAKDREHVYQIRQRHLAAQEREQATTRRASGQRALDIGAGAMRNMAGVGRAGIGVARDTLRGAGVNFDLGSLVGNSVDLESTAARTTTSAFTAKGKTAGAEDIASTVKAIQEAALAAKLDFNKMGQGLEDFVSKSADLETGKAVLKDLGMTARATGTNVADLVSAAGDIGRTLGDTPDKANRLLAIMRLIAKQGAMGNVELKDMPTYIGRMISSGFMYAGSIDENIGTLGAMSQVAMMGGASSAADATRGADAFSRDITKGAALERFRGAGIEIFDDKEKTKLRGPEAIITDFYKKTGGNLEDLASLFQNEMSKKVVKGFGKIASDAKAQGKDPIAAIHAEFARFQKGMTEDEVNKAAAVSMGTKEGQVQALNNQLALMGQELAARVLPQLVAAAPAIMKFVEGMVSMAGWAAENPGKTIVLAIAGSIAKAQIGEAVSTGIAGIFKGGMGGVGGASGGFMAGAGLSLALGMATIMIAAATISMTEDKKNRGREESLGETDKAIELATQARDAAAAGKGLSPEKMQAIEKERASLQERIAAASSHTTSDTLQAYNPFADRTLKQEGRESNDQMIIGSLKALAESFDASMAKLAGKEFKATVNVNGITPGVDEKGRK